MAPTVLWFRRDLRLLDHPALTAAARAAGRAGVVPLFVLDDALRRPSGAARLAFLAGCLADLSASTKGALVVRDGDPAEVVPAVAAEVGAERVYVSADFGPYGRRRDEAVGRALNAQGRRLIADGSPYAVDPGAVLKGDGSPYKVFTPYKRAWTEHGPDDPVGSARVTWVGDLARDEVPAAPVASVPAPGEGAADLALDRFLADRATTYADDRNRPDLDRTSRLSPYLKWGCIHPRTVLSRLGRSRGEDVFRSELCWRDFYADVLWHNPASAREALVTSMAGMRVDTGAEADRHFDAWRAGRTGFPYIDAGMRQLAGEGWMHNRVRMAVASFLVKDLHLDWTRGARHFMDLLVDGDLASNQHGWQWTAGTGTDASPYFRVFNPITQGQRFDPDGDYIARWVPELAGLAAKDRHEPWRANERGEPVDYPDPIVDHAEEREEALRRLAELRGR